MVFQWYDLTLISELQVPDLLLKLMIGELLISFL